MHDKVGQVESRKMFCGIATVHSSASFHCPSVYYIYINFTEEATRHMLN
jgi:hypothetical protein